jgi:hypothetical protein
LPADKDAKAIGWETPLEKSKTVAAKDGLLITGQPADQSENSLHFAVFVKVVPQGGSVTISSERLEVTKADSAAYLRQITSSASMRHLLAMMPREFPYDCRGRNTLANNCPRLVLRFYMENIQI